MNRSAAAGLTRRNFLHACAAGGAALASYRILGAAESAAGRANAGPARRVLALDGDWRFGGQYTPGSEAAGFNDATFTPVTLPHAVAPQSWQNWKPEEWQQVWIYRRTFTVPPGFANQRLYLRFDGVMVGVTPTLNGRALPPHYGGYLPFEYEVTGRLRPGENSLALAVDARWSQVPPEGSPKGPISVDYLEMGGIHRSIRLEAVPLAFIRDVYAKPVRVLENDRRVEVSCTLDVTGRSAGAALQVELRDGDRVVARAQQNVGADSREVALTLTNLGDIQLWHVDQPKLYRVVTTLLVNGQPLHDHSVRIGFREARFAVDGFFLNGRRFRLFGLNRHEVYPYVGYSMPDRVKRRDAEILKHDFHCNIVRCSHYPQSAAFLDACDELGIMVWQEPPGWQFLGDANWKRLVVRDVRDMIIRDRNRPSVVIWGTRVNESANDAALYRETRALARQLDDTRPSSGSMTPDSRKTWEKDWAEDVFAFDDYHAQPDGTVAIDPPLPGVPYFLAETVGQFNYASRRSFTAKYRRAGELALQQAQAIRHAQAHSRAAAHPRMGGVIAWCAFDYASLVNPFNVLKCPGVADSFRIPKLGGTFYLAQGDPRVRPVIAPNFYWDFGPQSPRGPGKQVAIFSNCEQLEVFIDGRSHAKVTPDTANYPHVAHAPFFVDLDLDGASRPELRIDGFVAGQRVLSRSFSADPRGDKLTLALDDREIAADGADATRLVFKVTDKFGAERAFAGGTVKFEVAGAAWIVGDNPFDLEPSGGVGAVWVRSKRGGEGAVTVTVTHSTLGTQRVTLQLRAIA